ncbi:MAG: hypothetical protein FWE84_04185 [Firmicutes bacterium]|nr:hypothetical protein [Bacillota bacterium]
MRTEEMSFEVFSQKLNEQVLNVVPKEFQLKREGTGYETVNISNFTYKNVGGSRFALELSSKPSFLPNNLGIEFVFDRAMV